MTYERWLRTEDIVYCGHFIGFLWCVVGICRKIFFNTPFSIKIELICDQNYQWHEYSALFHLHLSDQKFWFKTYRQNINRAMNLYLSAYQFIENREFIQQTFEWIHQVCSWMWNNRRQSTIFHSNDKSNILSNFSFVFF